MTYCLGIKTHSGLVMASDSRTNAGLDQVNICRKMHCFARDGQHVFILLSSGGLALTQSVVSLLTDDYQEDRGLAKADSMYAAARCVGVQVRKVDALDRAALERDSIPFNCQFLLGGQVRGEEHDLYLIYPQGNPLRATSECPFLQVGETKYGRPILDRGIRFGQTSLEEAAKYALLSLDSCMRSNLTVGPPIDLAVYRTGELRLRQRLCFAEHDPQLTSLRTNWEMALRQAVQKLPAVDLDANLIAGQ
jgi:putative proteasome-type protease